MRSRARNRPRWLGGAFRELRDLAVSARRHTTGSEVGPPLDLSAVATGVKPRGGPVPGPDGRRDAQDWVIICFPANERLSRIGDEHGNDQSQRHGLWADALPRPRPD